MIKNEELVSTIITTHNRKELLIFAIESVLNQTYKNIECIVVDDASDDNTQEYISKYIKEGKVTYIYIPQEESKGGNYARNLGVKNARGKYVAFLDDDDEWFCEKIDKQMKAMKENTDIGFVYCGTISEINQDKNTRVPQEIEHEKYKDGDLSKEVMVHIICNTSVILVKKELLEKIRGFDEKLKFWQEYEMCMRLLQITKAKIVRENLVLYRIFENDKNRLSNKISGWEEAVAYILDKHKILYSKLTKEEEAQRKIYLYIDGINRAKKAGSRKHIMKYMWYTIKDSGTRKVFLKKLVGKFF